MSLLMIYKLLHELIQQDFAEQEYIITSSNILKIYFMLLLMIYGYYTN